MRRLVTRSTPGASQVTLTRGWGGILLATALILPTREIYSSTSSTSVTASTAARFVRHTWRKKPSLHGLGSWSMGRSDSLELSKASYGTSLTAVVPPTRRSVCLRRTNRMEAFDSRQHLRMTFSLTKLCCGPLISRCHEASGGNVSTICFTKLSPSLQRTRMPKRSRSRSVLECPFLAASVRSFRQKSSSEISGIRLPVIHTYLLRRDLRQYIQWGKAVCLASAEQQRAARLLDCRYIRGPIGRLNFAVDLGYMEIGNVGMAKEVGDFKGRWFRRLKEQSRRDRASSSGRRGGYQGGRRSAQ